MNSKNKAVLKSIFKEPARSDVLWSDIEKLFAAKIFRKSRCETMMKYKGYTGKVEFDEEGGIFHGEVLDTKDVITFQAENAKEMRKVFEESVDDYLDFCKERGEEPDKPFSGQFVVRISPELHKEIYLRSENSGKSINAWVTAALENAVWTVKKEAAAKRTALKVPKGYGVKKLRKTAALAPGKK